MEQTAKQLSGFGAQQVNNAYLRTFEALAKSLTFRGEPVVQVHFGYVPSFLDAAIPPEARDSQSPVRLTIFTQGGRQASFQINASIAGHLFNCFQAQIGRAPLTLSHDKTMERKFRPPC